jgi:transposase-like protein
MTSLAAFHFHDADAARKYLETVRWPDGPICAHCGSVNDSYATKKPGVYRCAAKECRKDFSVTVGTIFERSHIPLPKWLMAFHLMCASKKGISARQLHRMVGVTYKTAWFMAHRIRLSMTPDPKTTGPIGGEGKTVEADETYLGKSPKTRKRSDTPKCAKTAPIVLSLVERGGNIRSVYLDHKTVRSALRKNMDWNSRLVTDGAQHYVKVLPHGQHESVDHSKGEYVRGDVHTNTLEGFFSLFKRGLVGTYQHIDEKHLNRYLAEFDFRQNTRAKLGIDDATRTAIAVKGCEGKRLTYRRIDIGANV